MKSGSLGDQKITGQQQRVLQLLFKFRFVSTVSLAMVMGIRKASTYEVLEQLVAKGLVTKVYKPEYRIDRRPGYYYLNKNGVTTVRKLMDVKESVVHTLYKNDEMADDFILHCMKITDCYVGIMKHLPEGSNIFSKTEINRFKQFPKNRPDLYIRTPDGKEAIVVVVDDKPGYIIRKRFDEIVDHSEDEGWPDGDYPHICFVLKDERAKFSFLYNANKKLEGLGMEEDELPVRATSFDLIKEGGVKPWANPHDIKQRCVLFS
jgi:predicted transcriptional regulator